MSKPTYIRCLNQKCQKLNPVPLNELEKEHTCIFCGSIIPPEKNSKATKTTSIKKGQYTRFSEKKGQSKPINKNMRKPMI